jgi:hypothetical protein
MDHGMSSSKLALQATWHCLLGCSIGEILGMMLGAHFMWSNTPTVVVSILLAFITGFGLSALPLVRSGMPLARSLRLVFAADSLSITTMEVVDNLIMVLIPGAMVATLVDGLFWGSMAVSLTAAFVVAYPVNRYLLERGKGHALTHEHMHGSHESHAMQEHEHHA